MAAEAAAAAGGAEARKPQREPVDSPRLHHRKEIEPASGWISLAFFWSLPRRAPGPLSIAQEPASSTSHRGTPAHWRSSPARS